MQPDAPFTPPLSHAKPRARTEGAKPREARGRPPGAAPVLQGEPAEGLQNFPKETVKKNLNIGLPDPSSPRFSNYHVLFLYESLSSRRGYV